MLTALLSIVDNAFVKSSGMARLDKLAGHLTALLEYLTILLEYIDLLAHN